MARNILIVDDEADFSKALTIRLQHAGYLTSVACDGTEAIDFLEKNQTDLIILDVHMPKMNGLDFIKTVKKNDGLQNIPIVFLTAGAFDIAEEVETLATAQDFMLKSVDNEQIIDRIKELLPD